MKVRTFEDFIKMYCDRLFWSPQLNENLFFQLYHNGDYIPQTTLRQETLNGDLSKFLHKLNWLETPAVKELPTADPTEAYEGSRFSTHKPNEVDHRTRYTTEMKDLIEKKCAKELSTFGYDFDGAINDSNGKTISPTSANRIQK